MQLSIKRLLRLENILKRCRNERNVLCTCLLSIKKEKKSKQEKNTHE